MHLLLNSRLWEFYRYFKMGTVQLRSVAPPFHHSPPLSAHTMCPLSWGHLHLPLRSLIPSPLSDHPVCVCGGLFLMRYHHPFLELFSQFRLIDHYLRSQIILLRTLSFPIYVPPRMVCTEDKLKIDIRSLLSFNLPVDPYAPRVRAKLLSMVDWSREGQTRIHPSFFHSAHSMLSSTILFSTNSDDPKHQNWSPSRPLLSPPSSAHGNVHLTDSASPF